MDNEDEYEDGFDVEVYVNGIPIELEVTVMTVSPTLECASTGNKIGVVHSYQTQAESLREIILSIYEARKDLYPECQASETERGER